MNSIRLLLLGCGMVAATVYGVDVTAVTATPRWPWNGKVDIDVTLTGTTAGESYVISPTLVLADGSEKPISTLESEPLASGDGRHTLVWNAAADYPNMRMSNVAVKTTVAMFDGSQGVYLVFDLSAGKDATSYPHRYTTMPPDLSSDVCRTTEFWMRRVPAGSFMMGNPSCVDDESTLSMNHLPYHQVKLTKDYYLGVFEVTQQQYFLMEGTWPSFFSGEEYRATRPLEQISMQGFRGNNAQNGWYDDGTSVDANSPLNRLRVKTGYARFDLPTEAQWERANRAGLQNKYNRPDMTDANAKKFGRNSSDVKVVTANVTPNTPPSDGGTAKVGSYPPNPWGFYDMGGNVHELCGDGNHYANGTLPVFGDYAGAPYIDPRGVSAECRERFGIGEKGAAGTTIRGGTWTSSYAAMTTYYRMAIARSISGGSVNYTGLRLCITCE